MDFFPASMPDGLRALPRAQFNMLRSIWDSAETRSEYSPDYYRTALLETPPFCDCRDNEMWDAHQTPARLVHCQNRPKLIEELATHLSVEKFLRLINVITPAELRRATATALSHLQLMCWLFVTLRDNRTLSDAARAQTRHVRPDAIKHAGELLGRVVCHFTDDDLEACRRLIMQPFDVTPLAPLLYHTMCTHGPKDLSDAARYYALASLLITLKFEDGPPEKVAKRIQRRVQRARNTFQP
jgi:hypothetical protein